MISKITNIQGAGTYESQYGMLYKFEYTFEDGTTLVANHKSQSSPFNVGDSAEYEVKGSNDHGSWGKVSKPDAQPHRSNADNQDAISRSVALNNAVQLHQGDTTEAEVVLATAENFYAWLNK
jgi:hypothetical protein